MILAGDMNVPAGAAKGRDVPVAEQLGRLRSMVEPGKGKTIDYVLALGFERVARGSGPPTSWTGSSATTTPRGDARLRRVEERLQRRPLGRPAGVGRPAEEGA